MIEATSCGGVVIFRGKILLLYKSYKNKYEGWVLPKGTVEAGEEYKDTASREVLEETGVQASIIKYVGKSQYTFNVPEDVNSDRTDIDWTNISIDGEMVSFPCTYNVLKQTYGTLYETKSINKFGEEQLVEVNPNEVGKVTKYLVRVLPKTGTGIIYFYFTSDTETELTNCMCTGVYVSSMSTENKPLIAVTLRGGVHFGSTADEILDPNAYEKVTTSYTNKNGSFEIYYKKLGYELKFYGVDKGLYSFEFDFNAYEKN